MNTNNKSHLVIFPLALIILFSPSMVAYGISSTPQFYLKDSSPYGTPYADWIKKWWQWDVSVPKAEHPQTNPKTVCATKVSGQVSFLVHNLSRSSTLFMYNSCQERYYGSYIDWIMHFNRSALHETG